eukprot:gene15184-16953_t
MVDANLLAVGTSLKTVQPWDAKAIRMVRELNGHASRVSSLSWQSGVCLAQQEVCGITWSPDGTTLEEMKTLCFWDMTYFSYRIILSDFTTVLPPSNILASGGGTADRNIKIWDSSEGTCLKSVDTGSQVCAIQRSDRYKELVSSHEFSVYQLIVWKYQDMTKLHELHGHTARVLHLAKSPCESTICSASADETLRFWSIFDRSNED